jgi:hypothetical protein
MINTLAFRMNGPIKPAFGIPGYALQTPAVADCGSFVLHLATTK